MMCRTKYKMDSVKHKLPMLYMFFVQRQRQHTCELRVPITVLMRYHYTLVSWTRQYMIDLKSIVLQIGIEYNVIL